MNLVGLDLSLTSTGASCGGTTSSFSTSLRGAERLSFLSSGIIEYCKINEAQIVLVEGYSFSSRNSQAHSIGELGGCVRMKLWECGIPFIEVPPKCRAKFATGKGNAGKSEVISAISARTGIIWSGSSADDQCDAWVLEQMGIAYMGKSEYDWPLANMAGLDGIDWSPLDDLLKEGKF
jgi:Holliday junction resolvasome RuvABC endonuclease subunit